MSTSVSFVCVPTPLHKNTVDLTFVKKAIISIANALQKKSCHLTVVRSTLLPGTTRNVILPILQNNCNFKLKGDFGVCYNPEFLRQKTALEDFLKPSRVVIGESDHEAGDTLEDIYSPLNAPIIRTDFETAEMIKHISNAFLATKISFFNEMYAICQKLGIGDKLVSETVGLDPRIGKYGVYGGQPFSGGCLPKDTKAFAEFIKKIGVNPDILKDVLKINSEMERKIKAEKRS